jgi:hypothetical protein
MTDNRHPDATRDALFSCVALANQLKRESRPRRTAVARHRRGGAWQGLARPGKAGPGRAGPGRAGLARRQGGSPWGGRLFLSPSRVARIAR